MGPVPLLAEPAPTDATVINLQTFAVRACLGTRVPPPKVRDVIIDGCICE